MKSYLIFLFIVSGDIELMEPSKTLKWMIVCIHFEWTIALYESPFPNELFNAFPLTPSHRLSQTERCFYCECECIFHSMLLKWGPQRTAQSVLKSLPFFFRKPIAFAMQLIYATIRLSYSSHCIAVI